MRGEVSCLWPPQQHRLFHSAHRKALNSRKRERISAGCRAAAADMIQLSGQPDVSAAMIEPGQQQHQQQEHPNHQGSQRPQQQLDRMTYAACRGLGSSRSRRTSINGAVSPLSSNIPYDLCCLQRPGRHQQRQQACPNKQESQAPQRQ
eukprot:scaffold74654_cov21-Tisochrysis_lutea.AAC.1